MKRVELNLRAISGVSSLTPGDGGAVDDGLERVEDELAVDEEADEPSDGGVPRGDGWLQGHLLLAMPRLVPAVQPHGGRTHLLHERLLPRTLPNARS